MSQYRVLHAEMQLGAQKSLKAVGKALLGKRSQTAVQVCSRTQHTCGGPLNIACQCLSKEIGVCTSAQMWPPPEDCAVSQGSSGAEVSLRELTSQLGRTSPYGGELSGTPLTTRRDF